MCRDLHTIVNLRKRGPDFCSNYFRDSLLTYGIVSVESHRVTDVPTGTNALKSRRSDEVELIT